MTSSERERQHTQRYATLGSVACVGALAVTPMLGVAGFLPVGGGAGLSVGVPVAFGLVAVAAGVQLSRRREPTRGVVLAAGGCLSTSIGVLYGTSAVF